jgi:hypothetical protein
LSLASLSISFAQDLKTTGAAFDSSAYNVYQFYISTIGGSANLYNGAEYTGSYPLTKGTALWNTPEFQKGTISYDNVLYRDIFIAYDLVSNEVAIKGYQQLAIKPDPFKIDYFILLNHRFVRINDDTVSRNILPTDFYDLIYDSTIKVYVKRSKTVVRSFRAEDPYQFASYNFFFVYKNKTYYRITNKNDLFDLFKDKSKLMKTFWRGQHLNFKKDPEEAISQSVRYYDQLKE